MDYHQPSTFTESRVATLSSIRPPPNGLRLIVSIVITLLTCFALASLNAWPPSTKRRLWDIFVYLTPSQIIYAMEFPSRRRERRGQGTVGFRRGDFGNQQAKSEALQRAFGFDDDSLATVTQRARRLSGLDKVLTSPNLSPAGLGNWDNSCYQNSIIQSLASLSSFDEYLKGNAERMTQRDTRGTHDALINVISRLNSLDNHGKRLWTPPALKSMNSWQQQDAQEYFSRIIDEVDREISKLANERSAEVGFCRAPEEDELLKDWQHSPFQGLLAQRVGCTRCGYTEGLSLLPFTCLTVNVGGEREYAIRDCLDEYTALESIEGVECIKCTILRTKTSLEQVLLNMNLRDASKPATPANCGSVSVLRNTVQDRLKVIKEVCEARDFTDSGFYKKCEISAKGRVSSLKSKQAVVARAPKDLVIHVNRSIFDVTGVQRKNHARVRFPVHLNLSRWCLGSDCIPSGQELLESWKTSPIDSMLPESGGEQLGFTKWYQLRAVITHYGGHENGHYIAYRKRPSNHWEADVRATDAKEAEDSWFCFSDDVVSPVSEDHVLSQGGVFMLFYEAVEKIGQASPSPAQLVVDETMMTAPQNIAEASLADNDDAALQKEAPPAHHTELDTAQSARGVALRSQLCSAAESSGHSSSSACMEDAVARLDPVVQTESPRLSSVAPVMRTAGPLSPRSRPGRRSSNISIHSPPFVTA